MIRCLTVLLSGMFFLVMPCTIDAQEPEQKDDVELFNRLFRDAYTQALRTSDYTDDYALAEHMLNFARNVGGRARLIEITLQHVITLASSHPNAYPIALDAMWELGWKHSKYEDQTAADALALFDIIKKDSVKRDHSLQRSLNRKHIEILMHMAFYYDLVGDVDLAHELYTQAQEIDFEIPTRYSDDLKARIKRSKARVEMKDKVEKLRLNYSTSGSDEKLGARLLQLYITEVDSPEDAIKFARYASNPNLRTLLRNASKSYTVLSQKELVELTSWYERVAERTSPIGKPMLLARLLDYTSHYIRMTSGEGYYADEMAKLHRMARRELRKLTRDGTLHERYYSQYFELNKWIDMTHAVHVKKNAYRGKWSRNKFGQIENKALEFALLKIPYTTTGSYEMRVVFEPTYGKNSFAVTIPVGDRLATVHLDKEGKGGLEMINGFSVAKAGNPTQFDIELENDKLYAMKIHVNVIGEQATIDVDLNRNRIISYTGPLTSLSAYHGWIPGPEDAYGRGQCFAIGSYNRVVTVRSIIVNFFDGPIITHPDAEMIIEDW